MAILSNIITPTNVLTATNAQTITNKTINGASNTISNISLTTGVTGTLPVANGGTGTTASTGTGAVVRAASLLTATDWTTIPDVSDPALSDPYLTNAAEFAAYRSQIRKIAVNPPVTVDVWPVKPEEVWSN